ncbi:hypothetical protein BU15DRAFT_59128 [Melanogaster broomeanus]|nr:hypothetical protein BU15DRAFT_59128 [Melanogaster broomeanus]
MFFVKRSLTISYQCTWPEGVPTRKKATPRKESLDGRPSTADSSGLSETSTPPTRDSTPPRRPQADYTLPPAVSRRHSEPYVQPLGPDPEVTRRQLLPEPRYDPAYASAAASMHSGPPRLPGLSHTSNHQVHIRPMGQHQPQSHQPQSHNHSAPATAPTPLVIASPPNAPSSNGTIFSHLPGEELGGTFV